MISRDFYSNAYQMEKKLPKEKFLEVYAWMISHKNLWEETPVSEKEKVFSDLNTRELLLLEELVEEEVLEEED